MTLPATLDRRVRLAGTDWTLWPHVLVRSAGFPVAGLDRLADPELAAAADRLPAPEFDREWAARAPRLHAAVADIAAAPRFRLAVGWQNHRILETGIDPLIRHAAAGRARNRRHRNKEQVAAAYWQRYCAKNESIGFFGPTVWGTVDPGCPVSAVRPGERLTDRATVFLEGWSVDAVAGSLAAELDLAPWFPPRRAPFVAVHRGAAGGTVRLADGSERPVGPVAAALLAGADGRTPAADLVARLVAAQPGVGPAAAFAELAELRRRGWLVWRPEVPPDLHAEDELRSLLDRIGDPGVRSAALARLDRLVTARDEVAAAWSDPVALPAGLDRLERTFVDLTGRAGVRNGGRAYGGRTLTYLDCRRDVRVTVGADIATALQPLGLLLAGVRWLTWRVRAGLAPRVARAHRDLTDRAGGPVDASALWSACLPLLGGELDRLVTAAVAEFHDRWSRVLGWDRQATGVGRIARTAEELRGPALAAFAAPGAGWRDARWCSPDVMVATAGEDALRRGEFDLVLGEVHAAMNALDYATAVRQHPDPARLLASVDDDFPGPRLLVALPKDSPPHVSLRTHPALVRGGDYRLALLPHTPLAGTGVPRLAADVPVVDRGGHPWLRLDRDGAHLADAVDLFAGALRSLLLARFEPFPASAHRPRITVDRMVLAREGWLVPAAEPAGAAKAAGAGDAAEPARFAAVRRWARAGGLPRRVFVKSPAEKKPFYVDFAGPVYTELLVTAARRAMAADGAATLKVTEMLPEPQRCWLTDADGARYTSELRMLAVDGREER